MEKEEEREGVREGEREGRRKDGKKRKGNPAIVVSHNAAEHE